MGKYSTVATGMSCGFLMLAGCVENTGLGSSRPEAAATAAADRPAATALADRDIEAPEVFQKSEAGLWDGRPSLGGVWVAHPDATDPERVLIRNASNGQTIIGALFRRERNNPGPRFQVSSDAAAALGMLAGAPVELSVTALRREEAPEPETTGAEAADAPLADADAEATDAAAAEDAPDAIASAAAAIDRAEDAPADAEATADPVAIAEPQKRRGFLGGLFAPRAASEPLNAVGAEAAPTEAGVALDATEVEAGTATLPEPAPAPVAEATDVEVADTASAAAPDAASAAETQSKPRRGFLGGLFAPRASQEPLSAVGATSAVATSGTILEGGEVITATALPAPATAPAPSRQSAALDTPYLQVATFRSESDAKEASVRLRERGIVPMIFEQPAGSDSGWRVVVGPASNSSEQSMLLRQVKRLGYDDAYAVSR